VTLRILDDRQFAVGRALESLGDAIMLLEWRYEREADGSIARLERLREELRLAQTLLESDGRLH
jgi:hypothetical protein